MFEPQSEVRLDDDGAVDDVVIGPVKLFRFSEYGIDFYWVNTLARQGFIEKNAQLVRDVQAGMMDGLKWTMLNPEEAVELHLKEQEELAISKNAKLFT